jgi:hypothetical protein
MPDGEPRAEGTAAVNGPGTKVAQSASSTLELPAVHRQVDGTPNHDRPSPRTDSPQASTVADGNAPSLDNDKAKDNGDKGFNNRHLRFLFVAYLFSATIGEIGKATDRILSADTLLWPAITHLCVAFFATSVSFVHWAATINEQTDPLRNIFSRQYLLLLLDLVLVIVYLSIVQQVDAPGAVSAAPEAFRLAIMYCLYAVWDFCHDVWGRKGATIWQIACATLLRCGTSLLCAGISYLIYWRAAWSLPAMPWQVCVLNVAEISNIVLFRAMKVFEWPIERRLAPKHLAEGHREEMDRYPTWRTTMQRATGLCAVLLILISIVFIAISAVNL